MTQSVVYTCYFSNCAAWAFSGCFLDMQILRPHPRSMESESALHQSPQVIPMHIQVREALVYAMFFF